MSVKDAVEILKKRYGVTDEAMLIARLENKLEIAVEALEKIESVLTSICENHDAMMHGHIAREALAKIK